MESEGDGNGHSNGVEKRRTSSTHVLIVPMVLQPHAVSAVRLSKKLAGRGVTVTLVMIKQNAVELFRMYEPEALQSEGISVEVLDTYQPPQIPLPLIQSGHLKAAFQPLREKLIADKKAGLLGPTCMLADRFLPWAVEVGHELDIPRYSFVTNAATTSRLIQSYHEIEDELKALPTGPDWFEKSFELICKQPGLDFLKESTDIPEITVESGWYPFFTEMGRAFASTHGIVMNTFYAFESQSVEAIRNAYSGKVKVPAVYPVGPLSTTEEFFNETFITGLEDSHGECVEWLGAQPSHSVLYVCLGSSIKIFGEQIVHLARALEAIQCRFLWVLSKGKGNFQSVEEVLPPGYLERVAGRGKIVTGWVGQLEILSNPAISAFLSHVGWQSLLESITCGVPILGWPQAADQRLNCRYMELVKVGFRVAEKKPRELVEQHEFEEAFKKLMSSEEGSVIAANAAKMKSLAAEAVAVGGPSDVALDQLVESFSKHNRS